MTFGYPIFEKIAPALNVNLIKYKLKPNFEIDLDHVKAVMTHTLNTIYFYCEPNKPNWQHIYTGTYARNLEALWLKIIAYVG